MITTIIIIHILQYLSTIRPLEIASTHMVLLTASSTLDLCWNEGLIVVLGKFGQVIFIVYRASLVVVANPSLVSEPKKKPYVGGALSLASHVHSNRNDLLAESPKWRTLSRGVNLIAYST